MVESEADIPEGVAIEYAPAERPLTAVKQEGKTEPATDTKSTGSFWRSLFGRDGRS